MDSQTSKRRRTDDAESPPIHKSEELWLPDGNIVIVVSDGTAYRVLKSFLGLHSEVFRDLFSAASSSADEQYDGCDVVQLPDPPEDIRHLLKALHFRDYAVTKGPDSEANLSLLCSLMRSSSKYFVESIRKDVAAHLTTLFPSSLEEYRSPTRLSALGDDFNGILGVIVGEECLPVILPIAYYQCAIRPIEETLDGIDIAGRRITLPPTAQRTALIFRQLFYEMTHDEGNFAHYLHEIKGDDCCGAGIKFALELVYSSSRSLEYDVLMKLMGSDDEPQGFDVCDECRTMVLDLEAEHQDTVWDALPRWCGRESWASLQMDNDA